MKLYRCPWCGKAAFTAKHRMRMSGSYNARYYRRRIIEILEVECEKCGGAVGLDRNLLTDCIFYGMLIVDVLFIIIFGLILKDYEGLLASTLIISFSALIICLLTAAFVTPPAVRIRITDSGFHRRHTLHADLQYEVEFNQKINLNIESIYAIRVKNVAAEDINNHFDLVNDYNRDGAPVYIRLGDFSHEMGLLFPENYDERYFNVGTEFDVIDVEGGKISTGVITRFIEKEQ